MPELPEVETVVRILRQQIIHKTIQHIHLVYPKIFENPEVIETKVLGKRIESIDRRGKYLVFRLSEGALIVHLRMEGKFFVRELDDAYDKHTHLLIDLGDIRLDYHDTRKFGRMRYVEIPELYFEQKLGLEPFDDQLVPEYLLEKALRRSIPLKTFLLDQSVIAGIGNIYSDEICFDAKLSPLRPSSDLSREEWQRIIESSRMILNRAIDAGGSSVRSYTASLGVTGRFQLSIQVYGRANQPCSICQTPLKKIKINQRSCVYCPHCQKVE